MDKYLHHLPMRPDPIKEHWLSEEMAIQEVVAFERRFGERHLLLACHAALPFILTPELLNLIHINFLDNQKIRIPWFAEADFLLSPLCRQIDDTLFEVEPRVREVLLILLEERFKCRQLTDIADFLLAYLQKSQELQRRTATTRTLRWIALSYLAPDETIKEIVDSLPGAGMGRVHRQCAIVDFEIPVSISQQHRAIFVAGAFHGAVRRIRGCPHQTNGAQ